jgi:hypothetical protein
VRNCPGESTYRRLTVGNGPFGHCQLGKQDCSTGGGERGRRLVGDKGRDFALLANLYPHYVLEQWVDAWRKQQAKGDVIVARYADDLVLVFEQRDDAEQFLKQLGERLAKLGLELYPDKTQLIEFGRNAKMTVRTVERKNRPFDFLGFTHYCRIKRGRFVVWRKTAGKRMRTKLQQRAARHTSKTSPASFRSSHLAASVRRQCSMTIVFEAEAAARPRRSSARCQFLFHTCKTRPHAAADSYRDR